MGEKSENDVLNHQETSKASDFGAYLEACPSMGPSSARAYIGIVNKFLRKSGRKLDEESISRFLKRDPRRPTKAALKHYLTYLGRPDLLAWLSKTRIKYRQKRKHNIPSEADFLGVIDALDKDAAMLANFLMVTGARCGEAVRALYKDIDQKEQKIVLRGKGEKERWAYFPAWYFDKLIKYLKEDKGVLPDQHLFYTESKTRPEIKVKYFREKLNEGARKVLGEERARTHDFRRWFATTVYKKNKDIRALAELLGHSDVNTTMTYLGFVKEEEARAQALSVTTKLQR